MSSSRCIKCRSSDQWNQRVDPGFGGSTAGATIGLTSFADATGGLTIRDAGGLATIGAVGSGASGDVTITNSQAGVTFSSTVDAGTLAITDTADNQDITFSGDVTAVTLTTTGNLYDVIFQEDVTVTNDVTFAAIRNLDIGGATDDTATFTGGLDTATNVTGTVTIAGTINTTNTQMDLGAVTLAADTTLDTGNAAAGVLNVGAVTSGTNALTLDSGSTAGATIGLTSFADATGGLTIVDAGGLATIGAVGSGASGDVTITNSQAGVTFSSTVDAGTLLITDTTGTVTVQGDLTAATLTTANQDYNVQFDEDVTITADASFLNTGTVALGSANDDVLVFNGGINTTGAGSNPSGTTLAGTLRTSGDQVDLGAVTLGADSVIDTTNNGGSASGAGLNIVSVDADDASGQDRTLTLNSGTGGTIAVSGAVGGTEALAGLDITNSNGATFSGAVTVSDGSGVLDISDTEDTMDVTFSGDVTAVTLTTTGNLYDVIFQEDVTVTNDVTFAAIRNLDIGGATDDTATFTGGLDTATNVTGTVTIAGTINTTNTQMDLGAVTLAADTTLDTGNAAAGVLNVGAVTSGTNALTLDSGSTAGATIGLTSFADATGGLTIVDAGGLATIGAVGSGASGDVTITNSQAGVTFSSTVDAGTLLITDTTGTVTVQGDLTAATLTTANQDYNVQFDEDVTITADASFLNTGTVALGSANDDVLVFNGGINTTGAGSNPSGTTLAGTLRTSGDQVDLGAVTLGADSVIDTTNNGGSASGAGLNIVSVDADDASGQDRTLTLNSGTGGTIAVSGAVGGTEALAGLDITNSNGATFSGAVTVSDGSGVLDISDTEDTMDVTFSGDVTAVTLTTTGNLYDVIFQEDVTVTNDVTFAAIRNLDIGGATDDTATFTGGLDTATNVTGTVTIAGTINTTNTQMDLGAVTLAADTTLDTGNAAAGVLNVGAVTSGTNALTLDSGSTAGATIGLTSFADATGGLTIRDAGGLATIGAVGSGASGDVTITNSQAGVTFSSTVDAGTLAITDTADNQDITFSGDVTAVTLTTTGNLYDVIFQEDVTVTNDVTFAAIRNLDIGGATDDTATFTGGLDTATNVTGTVTIAGTINTTNTQMDLGAVTLAADTTLDTGNAAAGVLNVGAVTSGTNALTSGFWIYCRSNDWIDLICRRDWRIDDC